MRFKILAVLTVCTLLTTMTLAQATPTTNTQVLGKGSVISFDFPGATNTQATGITPSGDIVGRYTSPDGVQHGFLLSGGKFRSINFPGATSTDVNWINPRGQIVGGYFGSVGNEHGFLLSGGKFTTIDYPNAQFTNAFGIGATGEIVGIWGDSAGTLHGFLLRAGNFSTLDLPDATGTLPAMISAGRIVGGYVDNTGTHGFSLTQGAVKTIDCPGSTFTFLSSVDPQGRMVGGYGAADGNGHGALVIGRNCIPVDFPTGTNTFANGINPQGDIVGRYTGADRNRSWLCASRIRENCERDLFGGPRLFDEIKSQCGVVLRFHHERGCAFHAGHDFGDNIHLWRSGLVRTNPACCAPGYPLVGTAQALSRMFWTWDLVQAPTRSCAGPLLAEDDGTWSANSSGQA